MSNRSRNPAVLGAENPQSLDRFGVSDDAGDGFAAGRIGGLALSACLGHGSSNPRVIAECGRFVRSNCDGIKSAIAVLLEVGAGSIHAGQAVNFGERLAAGCHDGAERFLARANRRKDAERIGGLDAVGRVAVHGVLRGDGRILVRH